MLCRDVAVEPGTVVCRHPIAAHVFGRDLRRCDLSGGDVARIDHAGSRTRLDGDRRSRRRRG
jgi:hypothetical protein